jgi:putative ABC transport system substrate-binding protein
MRRREFIALLGSGAAAWPLVAHAQQPTRTRSIGMLLPAAADNSQFQTWIGAFLQGLGQAGWTIGRNLRIDARWAMTPGDIRRQAAELAALAPDVILAHGAVTVGPLLQATRTVPIVFPVISDPVAADRILNGEKPGELPVQHATKFQLVINLKTAKALRLDIPAMLLALADEVVE